MADRIVAVLGGCSGASPKERLSKLINDAELPADIRVAVAQKAFSDRTGVVRQARPEKSEIPTVGRASVPVEIMSQAARDALLAIVSDASASAKAQRKAALKLATYFLPRKPVNKRWRFISDKYDFAINAEIAREYRDINFEIQTLKRNRNRDIPVIAQKIRELQTRKAAIHYRLIGPCPTRYDKREFSEDLLRLATFARKRENGIALTAEEDAEEAHRAARYGCYIEGPEQTAQDYRQQLEDTDRFFRKCRFFKDGITATPLSRRQHNDLRVLRWLYPSPYRKSQLDGHPFGYEKPASDGNFYPHHSKLRPANDNNDEPFIIEEYTDIPPYCILTPGQPPEFTYEPPANSSRDKSGTSNARTTLPST